MLLMSGVMVKLAVYAMIRVFVDWLGVLPTWFGVLVLAVGPCREPPGRALGAGPVHIVPVSVSCNYELAAWRTRNVNAAAPRGRCIDRWRARI